MEKAKPSERDQLVAEIEKLKEEVKVLTRVEHALKESEVRFSHLSEAAFEGIAIQSEGKILVVNKKLTDLFGFNEMEMVGMPSMSLIHPTERDVVGEMVGSDHQESYEATCLRKDGSSFQAEIIGKNIPFEGKTARVFVIRDISHSKTVERKLRKSEERFTKLFEESQDAIYISTKDGKMEEVNSAAVEMLGYEKEELIGLNVKQLYVHPEERAVFRSIIERDGSVANYELKLCTKSGKILDTLISASVRRNINNEVIGYQGIIKDITARKQNQRLEQAKNLAERSNKLKAQFLANMSHEIRTPMNAIFGLTNLLLETQPTSEQKRFIDSIKTSSEHLIVLINDILDFSKIEAGKIEFEETDFDLFDLRQQLINTFALSAQERNLELIVNCDSELKHRLVGDPIRLNQILINLVSNAIKFTKKGRVEVNMNILRENPGGLSIKFEVKDTGIGIPQKKLHLIFDSFSQADLHTTRTHGGTGLGLAISKRLVALKGGELDIESEVGVGSNFHFTLSYKRGPKISETAKVEEQAIGKMRLGKLNVLVVEDHKINQMVVVETLKRWGDEVKITLADNGRIGLEEFQKGNFDLILMDIQMPEMDGYQTTRAIRKLEGENPIVKIISMTAHATTGDAEKCIAAGMDDYISKPFDPANLFRKIVKHTGAGQNIPHEPREKEVRNESVDLSLLKSVTDDNPEMLEKMLKMLSADIPKEIDDILAASKSKDWETLRAKSHKFKSTASYTGNERLIFLAKAIEDKAKHQYDLGRIPILVEELTELGPIVKAKIESQS